MIMFFVHYPSGLVGLYPGSTFQSALSGTTKLNSMFESTVVLQLSLNTIKFDTTIARRLNWALPLLLIEVSMTFTSVIVSFYFSKARGFNELFDSINVWAGKACKVGIFIPCTHSEDTRSHGSEEGRARQLAWELVDFLVNHMLCHKREKTHNTSSECDVARLVRLLFERRMKQRVLQFSSGTPLFLDFSVCFLVFLERGLWLWLSLGLGLSFSLVRRGCLSHSFVYVYIRGHG